MFQQSVERRTAYYDYSEEKDDRANEPPMRRLMSLSPPAQISKLADQFVAARLPAAGTTGGALGGGVLKGWRTLHKSQAG